MIIKRFTSFLYLFENNILLSGIFLLLVIVVAITESIGIGSLMPIISIFQNPEEVSVYTNFLKRVLNISLNNQEFIYFLFISVLLLFLVSGIMQIFSYFLQGKITHDLLTNWQNKIMDKYLHENLSFFVKNKSGDLVQRLMVHSEKASEFMLALLQSVRELFFLIFIYTMLLIISVEGSLIVTILGIIFFSITSTLAKNKIYNEANKSIVCQEEAYSLATETISGIKQIKALGIESLIYKKFTEIIDTKRKIQIRFNIMNNIPNPLIQMISKIGLVGALFYIFIDLSNNQELISLIAVFGIAALKVNTAVGVLNNNIMHLTSKFPSVMIIDNLLKNERKRIISSNNKPVFKRNILFDKVDFSYGVENDFNLSDITIDIKYGQYIGIVGSSGCGKSTLLDLLMGFYAPLGGNIKIDGRNIDELDISKWRRMIGYVGQDAQIFSGTLSSNISLSSGDNGNMIQIKKAAEIASIHGFISGLKNGYKTVIGEKGVNLSGGQCQRLAIARAVYYDPEIYIFDEATSNLDTITEIQIQEQIDSLSQKSNKTIIAVAHRLSTVVNSDIIYVMENGNIVEIGNHEKLLSMKGLYAEMYNNQIKKNRDTVSAN